MAATAAFGRHGSDDLAPQVEQALLRDLRAGRPEAFADLYGIFKLRVYNLVLRIVQDPEDARDVTQEVFLKACRQLPGEEREVRLRPWLYRVAANAAFDCLRRRRVRAGAPRQVLPPPAAGRADEFEQAELGELFEAVLAQLSERHRAVLVLKDVHGLRHDEIARILGLSRGAAETLLFRAREAFRARYTALTRAQPPQRCTLARDATAAAVGGGLDADERRKVTAHARGCPDCRETVRKWGVGAVGLGLFLHLVPLPPELAAAAPWLGAGGAGAVAAGGAPAVASAVTGAGSGATGAAAAAGATAAIGGAATTAAGGTGAGLLAKLAGVTAAKFAAVALASATVATGAGLVAYEHAQDRGRPRPAGASAPRWAAAGTGPARSAEARGKDHAHLRAAGLGRPGRGREAAPGHDWIPGPGVHRLGDARDRRHAGGNRPAPPTSRAAGGRDGRAEPAGKPVPPGEEPGQASGMVAPSHGRSP